MSITALDKFPSCQCQETIALEITIKEEDLSKCRFSEPLFLPNMHFQPNHLPDTFLS